jgi:hypothetical protein
MPTGPNGQKRPADTNATAVMVARIAVGEIDETSISRRGASGGRARANMLSAEQKKEIASAAARERWNRGEKMRSEVMQSAMKETVASGRRAGGMYPNNSLRDPVRPFENVVFAMVKKTFTN